MQEYIALDVLLLTENEHSIETADPLERAEILRRWQPYFEQLPEYEYLREDTTEQKAVAAERFYQEHGML